MARAVESARSEMGEAHATELATAAAKIAQLEESGRAAAAAAAVSIEQARETERAKALAAAEEARAAHQSALMSTAASAAAEATRQATSTPATAIAPAAESASSSCVGGQFPPSYWLGDVTAKSDEPKLSERFYRSEAGPGERDEVSHLQVRSLQLTLVRSLQRKYLCKGLELPAEVTPTLIYAHALMHALCHAQARTHVVRMPAGPGLGRGGTRLILREWRHQPTDARPCCYGRPAGRRRRAIVWRLSPVQGARARAGMSASTLVSGCARGDLLRR